MYESAATLDWAPQHAIRGRMIFVAATRPDLTISGGAGYAMEMFQGGCLPRLRRRLGDFPAHRDRVRLVSDTHGILHPDAMLFTRDLTPARMQPVYDRDDISAQLIREFATTGVPREVMDLVEDPLTTLLTGLFWIPGRRPRCVLASMTPLDHWACVERTLDRWGWP